MRVVDPGISYDRTIAQAVSMWWPALAAADETMQGGAMAPAWFRLFRAHLSRLESSELRWGGDLGESAELRRAYSSLYGRYFARAVLASRLGFTDFVSLRRNVTTLPGGVTVTRIAKGDIPDWIAWDPRSRSYVLGEAKGNLTGNPEQYLYDEPNCIAAGKSQFARVSVTSGGRRISTRNWVAANLWSTDVRPRPSVSLLWDPPGPGETLSEEEVPRHAAAIRRRRTAILAVRLGRPQLLRLTDQRQDFSIKIICDAPPSTAMPGADFKQDELIMPPENAGHGPHSDVYYAVLMTPLGARPLLNRQDLDFALRAKTRAIRFDEPAMIFGLATSAASKTRVDRSLWLGEGGIASPDGLSLFDLRQIDFDVAVG